MRDLAELMHALAGRQARMCPRQVIGLRMGIAAARLLELELPARDRSLFVVAETDGSFTDALSEVTGCSVTTRMLRVEDHGKVAATFVNMDTQVAFRIVPHPQSRSAASTYAPDAPDPWHAQLHAYALMPDGELLTWRPVALATPASVLLGVQGRTLCSRCGEEILNQRAIVRDDVAGLCRACAGDSYWIELPAA